VFFLAPDGGRLFKIPLLKGPRVEHVLSTDFVQSLDRPPSFPKTLGCFVLTETERR